MPRENCVAATHYRNDALFDKKMAYYLDLRIVCT